MSLAALFWSGNFIVGRALRGQIDPLTLNFLRWLAAFALMAPFVGRDAVTALPVLQREWRLIAILAATGIASFHTFVYLALETTTATNALLILSLAPAVILLGSAITDMARLARRQVVGAVISLVGAGVLIARDGLAAVVAQGFNAGDFWMMVAVLLWTVYSLALRRRPADLPSTVAVAASIAMALGMMAPFLSLADLGTTRITPGVALGIGYVALFASALAFLLWSYGVARLGPARAGQFVHLMPIFGAALAFAALDEVPTPAQLAGAVLVIGGISVVESRPGRDAGTLVLPTGGKDQRQQRIQDPGPETPMAESFSRACQRTGRRE